MERGLDPFTTNLVVADPDRSVSTICLAITPAMKKLGIRNCCRIHETTRSYRIYCGKTEDATLYGVFGKDLWIYFMWQKKISMFTVWMSALWMSKMQHLYHLIQRKKWHKNCGCGYGRNWVATAGIGTNLYLAKRSQMEYCGKHIEDHIRMLMRFTGTVMGT